MAIRLVPFQIVHDRLIAIVAATLPSLSTRGRRAKFFHVNDGDRAAKIADSRAFWFEVRQMGSRGVYNPMLPRRHVFEMSLVIVYRDDASKKLLLESIAQDYLEITAEMQDVANWDQDATRIIALSVGDEELISHAEIEVVEGRRFMRIDFSVEFESFYQEPDA